MQCVFQRNYWEHKTNKHTTNANGHKPVSIFCSITKHAGWKKIRVEIPFALCPLADRKKAIVTETLE